MGRRNRDDSWAPTGKGINMNMKLSRHTDVRSRSFLLLGALLVTGCLLERPLPTSGVSTSLSGLNQNTPPDRVRPEEEAFASLAAQSPSSAGFYLDLDGHLVVIVRDQKDDDAARSAASDFIARGGVRDSRVRAAGVVVRHGEYTFYQLARWRDTIF